MQYRNVHLLCAMAVLPCAWGVLLPGLLSCWLWMYLLSLWLYLLGVRLPQVVRALDVNWSDQRCMLGVYLPRATTALPGAWACRVQSRVVCLPGLWSCGLRMYLLSLWLCLLGVGLLQVVRALDVYWPSLRLCDPT